MKYLWIEHSKRQNIFKSFCLLLWFPIFLYILINLVIILLMYFDNSTTYNWLQDLFNQSTVISWWLFWIILVISLIWLLISFLFQKQLLFTFSWAKEISRKENPRIYNIVENLCIQKWIAVPKIWIMNEDWMNAFALWYKPEKSRIVFTQWLLDNLEDNEIESVAWHELTHILNKDTLINVLVVLWIWIIWTLWYICIRSLSSSSSRSRSKDSWKWQLLILLIWLALILLSYLIFPLIQLAISRKREYLADAWSVDLTKDSNSMISALLKISWKSQIEKKNKNMDSMFFASPEIWEKIRWLLSTHPSIEDRIEALQSYTF